MPRFSHVILATLVALALSANLALAQKKPAGPTTVGTVKSVDAAAGTLTLAGKKMKDGTESADETITVAKDAKVLIDGKETKLTDLKAGAIASLTLTEDKKTATGVRADGGTTQGLVKAVDATANTITLAGKKMKDGTAGDDVTITVVKDAKISIDGEARTLGDIKPGVVVSLAVTTDKKSALSVYLGTKKKAPGTPTADGVVKSVDATAGTITLEGGTKKDGTTFEARTIAIAKDAKVLIDGESKALADITAGARVILALDAEAKKATAVVSGNKKKGK